MEEQPFDSFPAWVVLIGVGVTGAIYACGAYVLSAFGPFPAVLYVAYCVYVESSILRGSCRHCFYYGRLCALGRGKLCSVLFKKGDPKQFVDRKPSVLDVLPDLLVAAIPLLGGIVLLVRRFDWTTLLVMLMLLLLATIGTSLFRGRLACRYCAQRELGCPAQELFGQHRASPAQPAARPDKPRRGR